MGDVWYVSFVGFSSCYGTNDAVGLTQWLYSWKHGGKSACLGSHVAFAHKRDIFGNDDGDANDAATIDVDQFL